MKICFFFWGKGWTNANSCLNLFFLRQNLTIRVWLSLFGIFRAKLLNQYCFHRENHFQWHFVLKKKIGFSFAIAQNKHSIRSRDFSSEIWLQEFAYRFVYIFNARKQLQKTALLITLSLLKANSAFAFIETASLIHFASWMRRVFSIIIRLKINAVSYQPKGQMAMYIGNDTLYTASDMLVVIY